MSLNKNANIDILLWEEFLCSSAIWELIPSKYGILKEPIDHHENMDLSENLRVKLDKFIKINDSSFDDSYPPDSGFHSIEEVRYYLYFKLYVATLLSSEYKQGKVFLYGKDNALCSIEEYIKYLSTLTDEDLKVWLRADLQ
jgi:hypothetical protein